MKIFSHPSLQGIACLLFCLLTASPLSLWAQLPQRTPENVKKYTDLCRQHIYRDMKGMYREKGKSLVYPFLAPGSNQYLDMLWDWDSWLSDVALRQILLEHGTEKDQQEALQYEQGCVLNALHYGGMDGWIPDRYCISIGSSFTKTLSF